MCLSSLTQPLLTSILMSPLCMVCGQEVRVGLGGPSIKGQRAFGIFNLRRQGVPKHTWAQGEDRPLALLHPVLHSCPSQPPEPSGFLVLLVPPWFSWCPPGGGSCKLKSSSFSLTATPHRTPHHQQGEQEVAGSGCLICPAVTLSPTRQSQSAALVRAPGYLHRMQPRLGTSYAFHSRHGNMVQGADGG